MLKIVGDNPFNGVSHLSQERAVARGSGIMNSEYAAKLVKLSLENGADGFMFSINDTTLSILRLLHKSKHSKNIKLYAITPAAGEITRLMGPGGGVEGMVKSIAKQMLFSRNVKAVFSAINGLAFGNRTSLLDSFFRFELTKVKKAAPDAQIDSLMLHEIVTDMALSLDLKWLFTSHISFVNKMGATAGYETRNFVLLAAKFKEWGIDISEVVVAAPFNSIGFLMTPTQQQCEDTISSIPKNRVIAISALAAGYLKPDQAIPYLKKLNLCGVAIAVSNETQARETFGFLKSA